jgi:hypothetical protein
MVKIIISLAKSNVPFCISLSVQLFAKNMNELRKRFNQILNKTQTIVSMLELKTKTLRITNMKMLMMSVFKRLLHYGFE